MSEVMLLKYGVEIEKRTIKERIRKIINQVYKLLPIREQGKNWQKPLQTLIEEISGMSRLLLIEEDMFFLILCKLEGLFTLTRKEDMELYRRIILESLQLLNALGENIYGRLQK